MIKTQEHYEEIMRSAHNLVAGSVDLEITFNALRKVANVQMYIAKKFYAGFVQPVIPLAFAEFDDWLKIANPDLAALPHFLTDD